MTGLTGEQLREIRLRSITGGNPYQALEDIGALFAEIERLRVRPSCATCRYALDHNQYGVKTDNHVWCYQAEAFVRPEEAEGQCLWEAK